MAMNPSCTNTTGTARATVARNSVCWRLALKGMRIGILVTVAALAAARDSARAQSVAVMAQAIPVVTRADPTATRAALAEGYVSQPAVMAESEWAWWRAIATLNLEGLTLARGELSTG